MRRLALVPVLLVAACAPRVQAPPPTVTKPVTPLGATMIGFSENDLISRFGQPSFRVKEGPGTKLQWSRNGCVLDAYLYPPEGRVGGDKVTHVDTRNPSGADISVNACLDLLKR